MKFWVTTKITTGKCFCVEAESPEEARQKAISQQDIISLEDEWTEDVEWELGRPIPED